MITAQYVLHAHQPDSSPLCWDGHSSLLCWDGDRGASRGVRETDGAGGGRCGAGDARLRVRVRGCGSGPCEGCVAASTTDKRAGRDHAATAQHRLGAIPKHTRTSPHT